METTFFFNFRPKREAHEYLKMPVLGVWNAVQDVRFMVLCIKVLLHMRGVVADCDSAQPCSVLLIDKMCHSTTSFIASQDMKS